jgi:hypothetical protein
MQTTQSSLTPEQIRDLAEFDREAQEAAEIINEHRRRTPFWQRYQEFQLWEKQNPWLEQFITPNPRATSWL